MDRRKKNNSRKRGNGNKNKNISKSNEKNPEYREENIIQEKEFNII